MDPRSQPDEAPSLLRVMVFNIEEGGEGVDLAKVIEAIRQADPDVVALQEAETNAGRIATALGWDFSSDRSQVISRFPILEPADGDGIYVLVEVSPGRVVAVASVHPPAEPYGPELALQGGTPDEVVALERRIRLPKLLDHLGILPRMAAAGTPVFLMGDFNAPSHLDWTERTVGVRPQVTAAIDWPMSRAIEAAGFRDTWRELHPDPLAEPGLTWWADRPPTGHYQPSADTPNDRIDYLYASGPAVTRDCRIVGEEGAPDVAITVRPWPSDHRGLVASFDVVPATMPILVATDRRLLAIGEDLGVRWHRPGGPEERLALEPNGPVIELGPDSVGRATVSTLDLVPGRHEVVLRADDETILATAPVIVHGPGARTTLATAKPVYSIGEAIDVAWALGPGYRWDWIAVFAGGTEGFRDAHLIWRHTGARIEGSLRLDAESAIVDQSSMGGVWPLPPGEYVAAYLLDDGPVAVATAPFRIVP